MATKRANQADIAEKLGVSVSTVSRALANEIGISEAVRRDVQRVARMLGYKSKHTPATGNPDKRAVALVPLSGAIGSLASFYHGIVEGMRAQAAEAGIALDVRLINEEMVTLDFVHKQVRKSDASGVILAGIDPSAELVNWAAEEDIAVVLANGFDPLMRLNSVSPANFHGAYMATQHLIDAGHRRILHYTFRHRPTIRQRQRGFEAAIADHVGTEGVVVFSNEVGTKALLENFLGGVYDVTAMFCWNDGVAVSMVETLLGPDSSLPPNFSIMGFDDLPIAGMANPRLSTVRVDREAIGRGAIRLLAQRMDGEMAVQHLQIGLSLVAGETVFPA
ncbi:MAG: LacI family DNA-binding transcriptional regulator [Devosia sp.]|uniref:LacI family DNA-binding transcriptional regulator n=1 Tax=unclassified Devosia TaxID=196773 RepID=UPI0019E3A242|nr:MULTISPECIES: LacI family DNA-binding transcriptional regulator [unclassified Devosia]MBF0677672.1 LacI family DNA-binding transcriptional regulator [Devosia sp.]WEJ34273.1 LacI family transcriptional regulator [Devosia sp. SD17-2]